jgi:hypothetical protein
MFSYAKSLLKVVQPEVYPFPILIQNPDGDTVLELRRYAHGTVQKTVADCMSAVGFKRDEREVIQEQLIGQVRMAELFADAPAMRMAMEMLAAGVATVEDGWFQFGSSDGEPEMSFKMQSDAWPNWSEIIAAIGWEECCAALGNREVRS